MDGLKAAEKKSVMTASVPAGVCIQEFAMRIHSADRHDPAHTSHEDTM